MTKSYDFVNMKAHGNTALHMAAALRNEINQEEIVKLLLKHGADPSIKNLENEQAIHLVQQGEDGSKEAVEERQRELYSEFCSSRVNILELENTFPSESFCF
ncbi:NF-kappa-B inhibitor delta-like isoform X1 [Protopterus annectens]|uniref:NF-kappa-B inhibitor delta-like isoform X1 n=1 Tax=Protopterus annectens TaxID=7888 RepID=UPI001CFBCBFA|nr:NF-kappa-B inhibitor delta-like isoform X1 [Protopterus annectens]